MFGANYLRLKLLKKLRQVPGKIKQFLTLL